MNDFVFSALGPPSALKRGLRKIDPSHGASRVALWAGVAAAAVLYSTSAPGQFTITAVVDGDITKARFIRIQGTVENPSIHSVQLSVNGASQPVSVVSGRFTSQVPLTRGDNIIHASVIGAAANLTSGSNLIRLNSQIAPADVWSALTWDGPGDIDLHLVLPNGQHCFYNQTNVSGAALDIDNKVSDGPEHIVMEKAVPGNYQVEVVYYSQPGPPRAVHWAIDLRLRDGQERFEYSGTLERVGEIQKVAVFSFP